MIELYYAPTPNGWKITIMLEECGLPYQVHRINLAQGDQFSDEFLRLSPNNRMPAIVDPEADDGPLSVFESGAILIYLAEKTGRFLPPAYPARMDVLQWLFWQVGGLGPMAGQLSHFINYAPGGAEQHEYSHQRYANEYDRLFGVMERVLTQRQWLGGDQYSIADMASWPWVVPYKRFGQDMAPYPNLSRWFETIRERPAVQAGMEVGKSERISGSDLTDEQRRMMFGQTGRNLHSLKATGDASS